MKKILLGTTALVGAATLLAGAAFAGEDPKVTVGGFNTFEAGWTKSDNNSNEQPTAFRNDTEIHFNVAGKTDAGLGYGAEIDLEADINGASSTSASSSNGAAGYSNQGITAHRTYGWLQGDQWGHLEFGSNDGAASTLKVDASNIARASGGINGDYRYFADSNSNTTNAFNAAGQATNTTSTGAAGLFQPRTGTTTASHFITSANLPIENGPSTSFFTDGYTNDTKITYYTPRFAGFQAGVSYAPSLSNRGESTNRVDSLVGTNVINGQNIFSEGLNYEGQYDQVGIAAAVTGEEGHTDSQAYGVAGAKNLGAWNAGAKLSYLGFSIAGSYGDWYDSFDLSGAKADYWTGGLAYETGPIGASVTYLGSEDKGNGVKDDFTSVSAGVDYKLAPGLTPFVEYTWYDIDPRGPGTSGQENKGNVVLVGSQLSF